MAGVKVTCQFVQVEGGKKEIVLVMQPIDCAFVTHWQLDAKSARAVATVLVNAADQAERVIVMPSFDSTPRKPV